MNKPLLLFATQSNNPAITGNIPNGTTLNVDNAGNSVYQFVKPIFYLKKLIIQWAFKIDEDGTYQTIGLGTAQALKTYFFNIFDCVLKMNVLVDPSGQSIFLKNIIFPLHLIIHKSTSQPTNKQEVSIINKDNLIIRTSTRLIKYTAGFAWSPFFEIEINDFIIPCDLFLNENANKMSFQFSYDLQSNKESAGFYMDPLGFQIAAYGITE